MSPHHSLTVPVVAGTKRVDKEVGVDDGGGGGGGVGGGGSGGGGGGGGGSIVPPAVVPRFADGSRTTRPLPVNARPGDPVGDPVDATHPTGRGLTYSLSGVESALFTIDAETGQIRLGLTTTLELGHTYTLSLTATDSLGREAVIVVGIQVVQGLSDLYDLNRNGIIEKSEVVKAVSDYFAGLTTKDEALDLVTRYFAG